MALTNRNINLSVFIGCLGLILIALYFQHGMGMHPCPLCITQRIFVIGVGLVALLAALHNPGRRARIVYGLMGITLAAAGLGVALRHVWLQSLPDDLVPACGPGLGYMFENFPLQEAITLLLQGDGNCADVSWSLLGLSMPAWVAVCFVAMILVNSWLMLRRRP